MTETSNRKPKVEIVDRRQLLLRTVDVEQLVPEDDPVRAIWELTGQMDLTPFYAAIASEEGAAGREAIDPRLLISLWVYAYSQGISSAREMSGKLGKLGKLGDVGATLQILEVEPSWGPDLHSCIYVP